MSAMTILTQPRMRRALCAAGLTATLALTACAGSPTFNFYTLAGPASTTSDMPPPARIPVLIEVMPVHVPQQVQRAQLVLTTSTGQLRIAEQQRWSQPVSDEIAQALSQDLTRSLPAIDIYRSPHSDGQAIYRIAVDVQRFESVPGSHATLDAVWSVTLNPRGRTMTCHSTVPEPVTATDSSGPGPGYAALIDAHRLALQRLAGQIAVGIGKLGAMPASGNSAGTTAMLAPNLDCPVAP